MAPTNNNGDNAIAVLTNAHLLQRLTTFMYGVPFAVIDFEQRHADSPVLKCGYGVCRLALKMKDTRILAMLCDLLTSGFHSVHTRRECSRIFYLAVEYGDVALVHVVHDRLPSSMTLGNESVARSAVKVALECTHVSVEVLDWLMATRRSVVIDVIEHEEKYWTAFQSCPKGVVQWIYERLGSSTTFNLMDLAAATGNVAVVESLHAHGSTRCTTVAMDCAASAGHLDVVKFLHENRTEGCTTLAMDYAATHGHLNVVTFLHENRTEGCTKYAMDRAVVRGHLDVVQFLHDNHYTEGRTNMH